MRAERLVKHIRDLKTRSSECEWRLLCPAGEGGTEWDVVGRWPHIEGSKRKRGNADVVDEARQLADSISDLAQSNCDEMGSRIRYRLVAMCGSDRVLGLTLVHIPESGESDSDIRPLMDSPANGLLAQAYSHNEAYMRMLQTSFGTVIAALADQVKRMSTQLDAYMQREAKSREENTELKEALADLMALLRNEPEKQEGRDRVTQALNELAAQAAPALVNRLLQGGNGNGEGESQGVASDQAAGNQGGGEARA